MTGVVVVPAVAALVVLGVWVTGGLLTDDFTAATLLTGAWFAAAGVAALLVGRRWRRLALPVIGTYAVTAAVVGGGLLVLSHRDVVVHEDVVAGSQALARGDFVSGEHETTGTATLVRRPDGSRVVTLTDFVTSPGPDLRVYLVPGDGTSVKAFRDLGRLKGNKGDQQYAVAADVSSTAAGAVVVWCRAFSVTFGRAALG